MKKINLYFNEKQQQFHFLYENDPNQEMHYRWKFIGKITLDKAENFTYLIDEINWKKDKIFTVDEIKNYFRGYNVGDTMWNKIMVTQINREQCN